MRVGHAGRGRAQVHMVTQARRSLSDDIAYRQRRYLLMMGIRAVCFGIAVVFANGGREPDNTRGFMEYQPNLPTTRERPRPTSDGNGVANNGHAEWPPPGDN